MARLEISASAVEFNLSRCLQILRAHAASPRLIAVLKDNAYGHGAALVAGICRDFGISMCAVKNEREAAGLRGIFSEVLILSQPGRCARGGMGIYAINDLDDLRHLRGERVMLKIDSGMGRSGLRCGQISPAVAAAKAAGCRLLGAFTHFSSVAHIAAQQAVYAAAAREYLAAAKELNMLSAEADALARVGGAGGLSLSGRGGNWGASGENCGGENLAEKKTYINRSDLATAGNVAATTVNADVADADAVAVSAVSARPVNAAGADVAAVSALSATPVSGAVSLSGRPPKTDPSGENCGGEKATEKSTYINRSDLTATDEAATAMVNATPASPAPAAGELAEVPGAFFHSAASFGLFAGAAALDGAARVGLALYGYAHPSLRPAGRLIAERISTRELRAGDAVGYDGKFIAQKPMASSNYDLGYADGLAFYDGSWPLELGGAQVLGKFSMDSLSAATAAQEICIYEDAAVYAAKFGISVYEALVRLSPAVPRVVVR